MCADCKVRVGGLLNIRTWVLLLAWAGTAFGQLDSDTVTITTTRYVTTKPDQFVLTIYAYAPATYGLDDVLRVLDGSGITAADFSDVSRYNGFSGQPESISGWRFQLFGVCNQ